MNCLKINNFNTDQAVEKKIDAFLDDNFYSQISATAGIFGRATSMRDQYAGIDLSVGNSLVDEKSKNTRTPNQIKDYFASLEIMHITRDGQKKLGWFTNPDIKTTHYFFLYRFEDANQDISSVILVSFKKQEMKEYLNRLVGYDRILEDAKHFTSDTVYKDLVGNRVGKLTKSYESAIVLTFKLTDLEALPHTQILKISRGMRMQKMTFDDLRKAFTL